MIIKRTIQILLFYQLLIPLSTKICIFILAYRGCFSVTDLPDDTNPTYTSTGHMTIHFCIQICVGNNLLQIPNYPQFIAVMVSNIIRKMNLYKSISIY